MSSICRKPLDLHKNVPEPELVYCLNDFHSRIYWMSLNTYIQLNNQLYYNL